MGIWADYFHPRVILRMDVLGWTIPALWAIGGLVLFFDQFGLAAICFGASGALILARIIVHALRYTGACWSRVIFAVVVGGVVAGLTIWAVIGTVRYGWAKQAQFSQQPQQFQAPRMTPKIQEPSSLPLPEADNQPKAPKVRAKPNVSPTPQEPATPTTSQSLVMLTAGFVDPTSPALFAYNPSDNVVEGILWQMVAVRTSDLCLFSFATKEVGFIKPRSKSANYAMELATLPKGTDGCDGVLKNGDELTGSVSIDCPRCSIQTYIIHLVWQHSGWYYESDLKAGIIVPKDMSNEGRQKYVQILTSEQFASKRIEITQQ